MANVLSVLEKASDEDIRNQVATLEVVTIGNIMSTEGKEALNKAAGVVNSIGRFFGAKKRLVDDLKPKSIEEQIKDKLEEHAYDSRIALDLNLRRLLAERLSLRDNPSDERIAKELVNRAARHMEETNSHGKMLLCDNRFYLMTSYNFLSFTGNYNQAYTRGETGICSENERNIEELREEYFMF